MNKNPLQNLIPIYHSCAQLDYPNYPSWFKSECLSKTTFDIKLPEEIILNLNTLLFDDNFLKTYHYLKQCLTAPAVLQAVKDILDAHNKRDITNCCCYG